jgi:plastocyanin
MSLLKQSLRAFAAGVAMCCAVYALAAPPAEGRVTIDNFTFKPDVITVPIGTRIVWENDDDIPHTIVETKASSTPPPSTRKTNTASPSPLPAASNISAACIRT